MAEDAGAIPTIEVARVSAAIDVLLQQWALAFDPADEIAIHAAIMALVEPELARYHASRSVILAQRATIADLQGVVHKLATLENFAPEKRHAA